MSYSLTYENMDSTRPLDYSRQFLGPLNESTLSEPAGIGGPAGRRTIYGTGGTAHWGNANGGVDWNYDTDATDLGLAEDISRIDAIGGCGANPGQTHAGHNDWENIMYTMRSSGDFADGPRSTVPSWYEPTGAEIITAAEGIDEDFDGFSNADDNCPGVSNASQMNGDGDVQGDMCDNCPAAPNSGQENADEDMAGDACDLCPAYFTNWMVPPGDVDCDGFTAAEEADVGTDPGDPCPDDAADDAWPADFDKNMVVNILDLTQMTPPVFGSVGPGGDYSARKDFDGNNVINILDLVRITPPVFGSVCT
jgi:hypothetical protein